MTTETTNRDIAEVELPDDRPPDWANSLMKWALTTPVIQAMVGQGVALLTFTGRRSAKTYTIPVSYHRENDTVTIVSKRSRNWWRNFEDPAEVELRLAGEDYVGKAQAITSDDQVLRFMIEYLRARPIDAKAYGLDEVEITEDKIRGILPHIVVIEIEIASTE